MREKEKERYSLRLGSNDNVGLEGGGTFCSSAIACCCCYSSHLISTQPAAVVSCRVAESLGLTNGP